MVMYVFLGRSWQEKVEDVRKELCARNSSVLLVTALDEVACEYRGVAITADNYSCFLFL